jgi:hypothetical protein
MAALDIVTLDTATPQLEVPQAADTYNAPRAFAIAPVSLTGSAATTSFDVTQTWNTTGTPTAVKLNVTDTASNAASLLMDLQVGGSSKLSVDKAGAVAINGSASAFLNTLSITNVISGTNTLTFTAGSNATRFAFGTTTNHPLTLFTNNGVDSLRVGTNGSVQIRSTALFGFSSTDDASGTADTILTRDAANTLAQRDGTAAQTFRIYNTFTDASNYERGKMEWASNVLRIGTEKAGTGTARALEFQTDGTTRMTLDASGNLGVGISAPLYKLQVVGTSNTVGFGVTGTHNAGDIGLYIAPAAITGSYTAIQGAVSASTGVNYLFTNTNSANSSAHSRFEISTAGPSGGDPKLLFTVSTVLNYSIGVDNSDSDILKISASDSPGNNDIAVFTPAGNLGLGTATFGTSAAKVFSIGSGTEPSTGPADTVQFFSVDRSAGNTIPGIYCEGTGVTDAAITNVTVTNKIAIKVNGTVYYLLATTSAA